MSLAILKYCFITSNVCLCTCIFRFNLCKNCERISHFDKVKIHAHTRFQHLCPFFVYTIFFFIFILLMCSVISQWLEYIFSNPMLWSEISEKYWPYTLFAHGFFIIFGRQWDFVLHLQYELTTSTKELREKKNKLVSYYH